jgi:hypothetical protein
LLSFVTPLLAINDLFCDIAGLEQINGNVSIISPLHWSVENLLDNVVHDIMQEVVPRKAKEKAL